MVRGWALKSLSPALCPGFPAPLYVLPGAWLSFYSFFLTISNYKMPTNPLLLNSEPFLPAPPLWSLFPVLNRCGQASKVTWQLPGEFGVRKSIAVPPRLHSTVSGAEWGMWGQSTWAVDCSFWIRSSKGRLSSLCWKCPPHESTSALGSPGSPFSLKCRRPRFSSWVGKNPWRRKWQPTPVFLSGEFHGHWSLAGYSPWDYKESDTTKLLIHQCMRVPMFLYSELSSIF